MTTTVTSSTLVALRGFGGSSHQAKPNQLHKEQSCLVTHKSSQGKDGSTHSEQSGMLAAVGECPEQAQPESWA